METPTRQFAFEGVRIEQREAGELVWVARARRSDGDLSTSDALDVHMVHKGVAKGGDYEITSPAGKLLFDENEASFADVRIAEPGGGLLTAGQARYDGEHKRIFVDGPLHFASPGLELEAPRGEVLLEHEQLNIEGPVIGRIEAAESVKPPPPRSP